ncbi:MAG: hypothetical protein D6748_14330 [Calditrichaeota bacterium]|nr:MAG: hypothetical protein D6748_14330 [Calditrichota bacterium]
MSFNIGIVSRLRVYLWLGTFLSLSFFSSTAEGGAWVQKRGGYYLKLTTSYFESSQEFDFKGHKKILFQDLEIYRNPSYREVKFAAYLEYGISQKITGIMSLPFKIATDTRTVTGVAYRDNEEISNTEVGFADLELQFRVNFLRLPVVTSLQPIIKIPLGYDTSMKNEAPALGTGDVDYGSWLLLGKGFYPLPIYLTGGVGYLIRTGELHDQYLYDVEVGMTSKSFNLKLELSGVKNSTPPPDIYGATIITPLPGGGGEVPIRLFGDQDYTKLNSEVLFKLHPRYAVSVEIFHLISGKNVVSGTTYSIGMVFSR